MGAASQASDTLSALQQQGKIQSADLAKFVLDLDTALQGIDIKDGAATEAATMKLVNDSFGTQMTEYNAQMQKQIDKTVDLASLYASTDWLSEGNFQLAAEDKYGKGAISDKDIQNAIALTREERYKTDNGGRMGVRTVLDANKIEQLKQGNLLGWQKTVAATEKNTEKTLELSNNVAKNGQSDVANQEEVKLKMDEAKNATITNGSQLFTQALTQEELDKQLIEKGASQLTEAEFNSALQIETVSLLGLATQTLVQIAINTQGIFDGELNLSGKAITTQLREEARRSYALGGAGRKTIGSYLTY
jgi:hypothetical protein